MTTVQTWAEELIAAGRFANHNEVVLGLVAWAVAEGYDPHRSTTALVNARYNPLDTTEPAPGATDFNSVGVKDYPDFETGISATLATLRNGFYDPVLGELRTAEPNAEALARAVGSTPWGTGDFTRWVDTVRSSPGAFFGLTIVGAGAPLDPPPGPFVPPAPAPTEEEDMALPKIVPDPPSGGFYVVTRDGGVQNQDGAPFPGSLPGHPEWNTGEGHTQGAPFDAAWYESPPGTTDDAHRGVVIVTLDAGGTAHPYHLSRDGQYAPHPGQP